MDKHTPGPWHATKHTDTKGWTVSAGNSIASVRPREEAASNARLIAAAPDLLEVLEDWLRIAAATGGDSVIGNRARAAIKKARGE